jgi:hypothetical protein
MAELDSYIAEAREKGLSDEKIKKNLTDEGWDKSSIEAGLHGLSVPKPPSGSHSKAGGQNITSTGPLQSALHHVLLWFFLGSSIISIAAVTASLFGAQVSTTALASLIAVTIVTFVPYAVFFVLYLLKVKHNPKTIPGKIWTIITLCFASVGAMSSAITLVVSLVTEADAYVVVGSLLSFTLVAITLVVYGFATFSPKKFHKIRKVILIAALPAFAIMMGTLFVMSLLQLGPAKHDETLRNELVNTTRAIKISVSKTGVLPSPADAKSLVTDSAISYTLKSSSTYELCATFQTSSDVNNPYTIYANDSSLKPVYDDYIYESNFNAQSGPQCFVIESYQLSSPDYQKPTDL